VKEEKLTRLSTEAGVALLQSMGVKGSLRKTIPSADGRALWNEYEKLVEDVKGHALTLNLLGSYLRDAHAGDIRRRDLIKLEEADAEEQSGHAFHVMDAYVRSLESGGGTAQDQAKDRRALALLQLLGLFDRPATADLLNVLWQPPPIAGLTEPLIGISEAQRNLSLKRLEDAKLLTVNRAEGSGELITLDAHPLLREYFARRVRQQQPEAWLAGHQRLYEHLCATTPDKPQPTLEVLEPLYQAVAHGCQAGLQQEACDKVYLDRILRGREFYSTSKLGAIGSDLGAVACFFEPPWSRVSRALTEAAQAWLLNQAAFRLRALGRLTEALEPMRAGLPIELKRDDRKNAAIRVSNLSELELTLGDVGGAVRDAEQSVTYADRSGDAFWKVASRCKIADALHQAGRRAEAEARFREAEQMQAERQPDYRLLYSVRGFHYCDLQLAGAERAAWQRILDCGGSTPLWDVAERPSVMESLSFGTTIAGAVGDSKESGSARESGGEPPQSKALRAVSHRAAHTLNWYEENKQQWLLDIALDHLTLGRVALYAAILERSAACSPLESSHDQPAPKVLPRGSGVHPALQDASRELDTAVTGLRRAGMQDYVPRGLLIRAWLRSLTCAPIGPESAQSDLDEAWEIAERGPMKLFLADIHLYRARLFFREPAYPWQSPQDDLAAAEKLIDDCGYHRRDEELADAKKAIL
jgi:tetratricopeptide (TPR) repeat protein